MRLNHHLAATAFRAVARTFSERVRVVPLLSSEYAEGVADPDRAPVNTRATVALSPRVDDFDGVRQGRNLDTNTRFAERNASIWFPPAVYAGIGYRLRTGDRVVLVERAGQPAYSVARDPVSSDRGDVSVYLVEER